MKEPRAAALSAAVGHLMCRRAEEILAADLPQLLTFSPMHWRRRISRRINNAERLANALARGLPIPVHRRLVVCARQTRKQSLLSVHQRRDNVHGAFKVPVNVELDGLHVGLVDDTMTTGATADEIARMLRRAGAARITVFLAARGVFR
jgi:predicted amidophosphoribosyltransferase